MRHSIVIIGFLLTVTPQLAAGVDPLEWVKPVRPPAFRNLLSAEEFAKRSHEVLQTLGGVQQLEASAIPDHGIRFLGTVGDSQVAAWNLQPGDLILKADPHDLWGGPFVNRERRRVTVFEMSSGKSRSVTSKPEFFSIFFGGHWRPELTYLRTKDRRNAAWDDFVTVGAACRESAPDLAETAWFRALEAGYKRDGLTEICGALIALVQNRPEVAADFAYLARAAEPKTAKFVSPVALLRVMLACYKLDDAYELCQKYPNQLTGEPRIFRALADVHRSWPESDRRADSPVMVAERRYRNDLLNRCLPLTTFARDCAPKLREGNGLYINIDNGIEYPMAFSPPEGVRDLEATVRFSVLGIATGPRECRVEVGLFPPTPENHALILSGSESSAIKLNALSESRILLNHGHDSYGTLVEGPGYPITLKKSQEVRIIRIGGQVEVWVNGHRILYQPLPPLEDPHLALMIRPVSVNVKIENVQFYELLEKR